MPKSKPIVYSHTAITTFKRCQKKFYFGWLPKQKQGWRKKPEHPWYHVHILNQVCHSDTWAGKLYHQVIAYCLSNIKNRRFLEESEIRDIGYLLAEKQFYYSQEKEFIGNVKSKAPEFKSLSTYLALFEHMYELPDQGILEDAQQKLDLWLINTFNWDGWQEIKELVKKSKNVHIEPNYLHYYINGARILARMDLGIETASGELIVYDWKCYKRSKKFEEYNQRQLNRQLGTYAFWGKYDGRFAIDSIIGRMFNPVISDFYETNFSEEDVLDFELIVSQWVKQQRDLFPLIEEIIFDELRGPFDSEKTCPWCEFKAICSQEIEWHTLK